MWAGHQVMETQPQAASLGGSQGRVDAGAIPRSPCGPCLEGAPWQ